MKLARSKNAVRNIRVGFIGKIIGMLCPFFVRTTFIHTLGMEYLGVNGLFTSVLSVLSLTELGFGSAVVFSMYQAIADDDSETINALLYFYRKIYRYVGCIILGIGLLLIPCLPHLTLGSYPSDINPLIVYLVFLANTCLSYFLFAYLNSLLDAFQRTDINTIVSMFMNVAMSAVQIVLLLTVRQYYAYLVVMPVFTVLGNIRTAVIAHRMFPQYKPSGKLAPEVLASFKKIISGLMIQKLSAVSRNAFDSIFVSMFLGLTQTALYNNYFYIINSVAGFTTIVYSAVLAGAGNSVATETKEKNHRDMMKINFAYMWVGGWFACCLMSLFQPFMKLWAGTESVLPLSSAVLFSLYFFALRMEDVLSIYVNAVGMWWHNRYRALAEAITNIVLNYFLGKFFGVNGIIAATLISLFFINFCYGSQLIYRFYFTEQKMSEYYIFHGICASVTAAICAVTYFICRAVPETFIGFVVKICICAVVPNALYFVIYRKTKMYHEAMPWILERVGIQKESSIFKLLM